MFIRVGMGTDTNTIGLHNHRVTGFPCIFVSFGHGIHRIEYIFSIAIDDFQVLETGEVLGYFAVGCLFRFRDRDTISVVLYHKNHRKTFKAGAIDSLIYKSFGSGRFSVRSDGDSFMSIIYHCPRHTCRMKVMRSRSGRNVFDVPFRFGEMVRHVTSAATRVCRFRDTIQDDFFRSHSGRKYSQHIAVVRKQEVFAQSEYLTDGKLNTIMPRVRSMIRPTQRLQQV